MVRFTCPKCKVLFIVSREWMNQNRWRRRGPYFEFRCPNGCYLGKQYTFELIEAIRQFKEERTKE